MVTSTFLCPARVVFPLALLGGLLAPLARGEQEESIGALVDALATANYRTWYDTGVELYRRAGGQNRTVLPALVKGARHPDERVRAGVMVALQRYSYWPEPLEADDPLPILLAALQDKSALVRYRAAYAIGPFAHRSDKVVPALLKLLDDKAEASAELMTKSGKKGSFGRVCAYAANGLAGTGSAGRSAVPILIKRLEVGDDWQQRDVISTLGYMTSKDRALVSVVVPVLARLAEDRTTMFRTSTTNLRAEYAIGALGGIGPPAKGGSGA